MSLQVWLPLNQGPENVITDISNFGKESGISITADTNGWYKIADSSHTSSRWGIYKDFYVKSNTTYTLNVYAKSTTGVTANVGIQSFNGYTNWPTQRETYNGSSEKLITFTWTTAATDNYARVYLAMNPSSTVANNYVFYKGVEILEVPEIKNQGLADIDVINNGATYSSTGGKIGGCYNFDGSDDGIRIDGDIIPQLQQNNFSICFWLFSNDAGDRSIYIATTPASDWGFSIEKTTANKLRVYWQNNPDFNSSLDIPDQQWCHIAVVIKDGNCYCYKNGEKLAERTSGDMTPAKLSRTWIYAQLGRDTRTGSTVLKGKMNDFRWYDHALSQIEIKKIAKGLVLHYPLNRRGCGQENLLKANPCSGGNRWIAFGNGVKIDWTSNAGDTYWYLGLASGVTLIEGDTYTLSCQCLGIESSPIMFRWCNLANYDFYLHNGWNYYTFNMPAKNITNPFFDDIIRDTTLSNLRIWNFKLEKGNIATPWSPPSSDASSTILGLNSTIEYDTSGFGNHGTRYGTFTYSSDTPKYHVSTYASGSTITYLEGPILPAEAKTVSLWIKANKSSNGAIFNDKTSGLQIGLLNSLLYMVANVSTAGFTTTHWVDGQWNHVVAVNNNGTCSLYVNGQAEIQSGAANYYVHNADNCWLWNRSYNNNYPFTGSLSDLQVYATALSASDVLELYNNKNF